MRPTSYDPSVFPKPRLPTLPLPSLNSFTIIPSAPPEGVLSLSHKADYQSGRYALAALLIHEEIGQGDSILIPAYHCLAMIEPLRQANVKPIFYPVNPDLSVNRREIKKRADSCTRAIIVVHYFGFPQNFSEIRELADSLNCLLIEDCAHACFGSTSGKKIGALGDYAIASTMKFFPIGYGGLLASAKPNANLSLLKSPPIRIELKQAFNLIEAIAQYRKLSIANMTLNALSSMHRFFSGLSSSNKFPVNTGENPSSYSSEYLLEDAWLKWRSTRISRFLLRHTRIQKTIERRRTNYQRLLDAVANRDDCFPIFSRLPKNAVPMVFPLFVKSSLQVFITLKSEGVPIIRFGEFLDDEVDSDLCPISTSYSGHVLQFTCHQSLSDHDLEWIIDRLISALDSTSQVSGQRPPLTAPHCSGQYQPIFAAH